ncbi:MAG: HEAT repeat domain-containing protein [Bacteroidota bacterium]
MKTPVLKVFLMLVCLALWGSPMHLEAQEKISRILELISVYDDDQSRAWQQEFQDLMKRVYKDPDLRFETERMMLDFLGSDATLAGKRMICRELGIIGSEASVPVLSTMLSNPGMGETALLALEKIPGADADEALRAALRQSGDQMKVTLLNSLALRKDVQAIEQIRELTGDPDRQVAGAAIAALGTIGSPACADILENLFHKSTGEQKWSVAASWLKCTDLSGYNYLQVFESDPPPSLKSAALKGMFVTSDEDPGDFIAGHLKNEDPAFHRQIISLVYMIPHPDKLGRLFSEVPSLPASSELFLLSALADVGDFSVRPEIMKAMHDGDPFIREAAIRALPGVGLASDASLLAGIAAEKRGSERETARQSLNILAAEFTNDSILAAIESTGGSVKAELILSTGERNITDALSLLFTSASGTDQAVRTESLRALGKIAPPDALPQLIGLLLNAQSRRERMEAERSVLYLIRKLPDGQDRSGEIMKVLSAGTDQASAISLISILGQISDTKDLPILLEFLASGDDEIQLATIKALSGWPDASPLPDLMHIAQSTDDQRKHTLSLRASVEVLVSDMHMPTSEKLEVIRTAWEVASNADEKKIIISGLSQIASIEAFDMALDLLSVEELRNETEAAVLTIADNTGWEYPGETRERLLIFLEKTGNPDHKAGANRILERLNR